MAKLKTQVKKFLSKKLTGRIMEQLVGLNEENQLQLKEIAQSSSSKLIKAYLKAIKHQQNTMKPENSRVEKNQVIKQSLYIEPAVMAS